MLEWLLPWRCGEGDPAPPPLPPRRLGGAVPAGGAADARPAAAPDSCAHGAARRGQRPHHAVHPQEPVGCRGWVGGRARWACCACTLLHARPLLRPLLRRPCSRVRPPQAQAAAASGSGTRSTAAGSRWRGGTARTSWHAWWPPPSAAATPSGCGQAPLGRQGAMPAGLLSSCRQPSRCRARPLSRGSLPRCISLQPSLQVDRTSKLNKGDLVTVQYSGKALDAEMCAVLRCAAGAVLGPCWGGQGSLRALPAAALCHAHGMPRQAKPVPHWVSPHHPRLPPPPAAWSTAPTPAGRGGQEEWGGGACLPTLAGAHGNWAVDGAAQRLPRCHGIMTIQPRPAPHRPAPQGQ